MDTTRAGVTGARMLARRPGPVLSLLACGVLLLGAACARSTGEITSGSASTPLPEESAAPDLDSGDGADLFAIDAPTMVSVVSPAATRGELVVPGFCRAKAAGVRAYEGGFLLAVDMEGSIPPTDDPPGLPFGVVLLMHEFHLGVFAPEVEPDLGGGYTHIRQYQIPDRPSHRKNDLGSGSDETLETQDVDVRGSEIRIAAPALGPQSDRASEWGVRVTCVLRHPVEGVYFPATRIPLGEFERLPLG